MKVELENTELGELWSQYTQIRAKLTARIEAEILITERRLSCLSEEALGQLPRVSRNAARRGTVALVGYGTIPAISNDPADQVLLDPLST